MEVLILPLILNDFPSRHLKKINHIIISFITLMIKQPISLVSQHLYTNSREDQLESLAVDVK